VFVITTVILTGVSSILHTCTSYNFVNKTCIFPLPNLLYRRDGNVKEGFLFMIMDKLHSPKGKQTTATDAPAH
jgi:hypothetical protein